MINIRRKYCFEDSRNRVQGILPFAVNGSLTYPNMTFIDGNWGEFIADFGYEEETEYDKDDRIINEDYKNEFFDCHIVDEDRDILRWRYKYKNLMRHYNYTINLIRNGILLKRGSGNKLVPAVDCDDGDSFSTWWTDFFDGEVSLFDYDAVNYNNLEKQGNHLYVINGNPMSDFVVVLGNGSEDCVSKIQSYNEEWISWLKFVAKKTGSSYAGETGIWTFCKDVDTKYIGYVYVPKEIQGKNVPDRLPFADVAEYLAWFENNEDVRESCCVTKENTDYVFKESDEWVNHGGQAMWDFLKTDAVSKAFQNALKDIKDWEKNTSKGRTLYLPPCLELTLSITQVYQDEGVLTPYMDKPEDVSPYFMRLTTESGWIESQLSRVKMSLSEGDDGSKVDGIFREYPTGPTYFKCVYVEAQWQRTIKTYGDGDILPEPYDGSAVDISNDSTKCLELDSLDSDIDSTGMNNRDWIIVRIKTTNDAGEESYTYYRCVLYCRWEYYEINGDDLKYTENTQEAYNSADHYLKLTVKEVVPGIYSTAKSGDFVNVLASYQCYIDIPYSAGTVYSEYAVGTRKYGDYIIAMDDGHFIYTIGGEIDNPYSCGYVIEEDYELVDSSVTLTLDGVSIEVPQTVMMPIDTIDAYSESLGMVRYGVPRGRLVGITTNFAPKNDTPLLFKRDGDSVLLPGSKISVDITVERGASAAFENFYKLSECNTMEDVENYGNDYFNLQNNNE